MTPTVEIQRNAVVDQEELVCVNKSRTALPERTCTHHSLGCLTQQRMGNPQPNRRLMNIRVHHRGLPCNQSWKCV
jgi:hypothetical protein